MLNKGTIDVEKDASSLLFYHLRFIVAIWHGKLHPLPVLLRQHFIAEVQRRTQNSSEYEDDAMLWTKSVQTVYTLSMHSFLVLHMNEHYT